jgi:hypothetical protein
MKTVQNVQAVQNVQDVGRSKRQAVEENEFNKIIAPRAPSTQRKTLTSPPKPWRPLRLCARYIPLFC